MLSQLLLVPLALSASIVLADLARADEPSGGKERSHSITTVRQAI